MTPAALKVYLTRLVEHGLRLSTMLWGPPGIGKSSIVGQVAKGRELRLIDLRLSQLAPTDLRGLPVPEDGVARWYPPEFLPRDGAGILFLDEINMAPPTLQGIAQQLILDRRVGAYTVPEGWFIWAAGNRKEDRASVFEMPAPLSNRFIHLDVAPDYTSFRSYALTRGLDEHVQAFLAFRPELLMKLDPHAPAWPSPRSWEMASRLHAAGLDVAPAVGEAAAGEFEAYVAMYRRMPDLEALLAGDGRHHSFPREASVRYAVTVGLSVRAETAEQTLHAYRWLADRAGAEWIQLFAHNVFTRMQERGEMGKLAPLLTKEASFQALLEDFTRLSLEA